MDFRAISMSTIKKLLKETEPKKQKDGPMFESYKERWPGETNLVKLAKAVQRGASYVVFKNGDRFNIKYVNKKSVLIKPDFPQFVPMGYFSRDSLKQALVTGIDLDE